MDNERGGRRLSGRGRRGQNEKKKNICMSTKAKCKLLHLYRNTYRITSLLKVYVGKKEVYVCI